MKKLLLVGTFLLSLQAFSGPGDDKKDDPVLMVIKGKNVPLSEFKYIYEKNNSKAEDYYSEHSIREYLKLFINFKLKVFEAENLGMDTINSFVRELNGYKKQLAKPYLTEKSVTERLIKEAYERKKIEINASHILLKLRPDASPEDTLKVYNKIMALRKRALKGEDFGLLAKGNSQDPSAQTNSGNLGYFSSLQMVYPFENAAFNTKKGEISMPARTRFGYHILKIHNKRTSSGKVHVAHIMIDAAAGIAKEDSTDAKRKIDEIYNNLKGGGDWNKLCQQFSDHAPTRAKNGEFKPFGVGEINLPPFENAAFALNTPGELSKPFKSPYGWHIIKLIKKIPLPPFEEMKDDIKRRVQKDSRNELNRKALVQRLKTENKFKESKGSKKKALALADTSLIDGKWNFKSDLKISKKWLFKMAGRTKTVKSFLVYVRDKQRARPGSSEDYLMNKYYTDFVETTLIDYEEKHLADKYYDYKMLIKEYRDGILLFELMDDMVWSRAVKDTTGLKDYFNSHIHNYKWERRVKADIYDVIDEHHLDELKKLLKEGKSHGEIEEILNKENPLNVQTESGTFQIGEHEVLDKIKWANGIYTEPHNDRIYLVNVKDVLKAEQKKFGEARGLVISDYQNYLEDTWLEKLKAKYPVKVNEETLQTIIK